MRINTAPSSPLQYATARPPSSSKAAALDRFTPRESSLPLCVLASTVGAVATGVALNCLGQGDGLSTLAKAACGGILGGVGVGALLNLCKAAPLQAPVPVDSSPTAADFLEASADATGLLALRASANRRYLDAESLYANLKANVSVVEGPKDELKDLDRSWKLLPKPLDPTQVALPGETRGTAHELRQLQRKLLEVRGQGQAIFDEGGHLREGLYVAKGPRASAQQLISDAKAELSRVETLLERLAGA